MSGRESWTVELTAGDEAGTDSCLYLPPNALPRVDLPKRLLARGSHGAALVGFTRIEGAIDESVIRVSPTLLTKLAAGHENDLRVAVNLEQASWGDVYRYSSGDSVSKVLTAIVVATTAIAAAIVAFVTRKIGVDFAATILGLAALAAVLRARTDIRDAIRPKCH